MFNAKFYFAEVNKNNVFFCRKRFLNLKSRKKIGRLIFIPTTTRYLNAIPKNNPAYNEKYHVYLCIGILCYAVQCSPLVFIPLLGLKKRFWIYV